MNWFYDSLIFGFLAADALLIAVLFVRLRRSGHPSPSTGEGRVRVFLLLALLAWLLVFYGSFIEPQIITVRRQKLDLGTSGSTLRVALISDLHAGAYPLPMRRLVSTILKEQPDAILIAGDLVSGHENRLDRLEPLKNLTSSLGTYAVFGNHDYLYDSDSLERFLEERGVRVLRNESVILEKDSQSLTLVGIDDLWFGTVDFAKAATEVGPQYVGRTSVARVLLAHNPDIVYALGDEKFDAILAAHTHGGQIRLPWIGAIPPLPTVLGRKYDRGRFDWNGTPLLITQGIGVTGPRARLFAPPEIMIIEVSL